MTRAEIVARFRAENPEITDRVLTDNTLNSWLIEGNMNFCCLARLIQKSGSFTSVEDTDNYNMTTSFSDFYEIDEFPGGGIAYDGDRLSLVTKAELDNTNKSWRDYDSGTPKKYYRRNEYVYFDRAPDDAVTVSVDYIAIPDEFNNDSLEPFNGISVYKPYHYALVLYLQGRAKMAVGKDNDKTRSMMEYDAYVTWCKRQVGGGKFGKISMRNADGPLNHSSFMR